MGLAAFQFFKSQADTSDSEMSVQPPLQLYPQLQPQHYNQPPNMQRDLVDILKSLCMRDKRKLPVFTVRVSPFTRRIPAKLYEQTKTWNIFFCKHSLFSRVVDFLNAQQCQTLKRCSKAIFYQIQLQILSNDNNWNLTLNTLAPYIQRQMQLKQSGISEDYQHSEDLDRTSGYFQNQNTEDVAEHQFKLDRIITTLSFKVKYFQGIMPICASLLQCFNQNTSYWLLRYLLHKCRYIQNDVEFYHCYLIEMDSEFRLQLPAVHHHLEQCGFQLNYFAMKWIMGLFAEDMSKTMLLAFWDALCQTDVYLIMYLIIQIFTYLAEEILHCNADQINEMLKLQLKDRLSLLKDEELMRQTKYLYIQRRLCLAERR